MRNSAFPAATSNDGNRNISFDSAAITAFAATLAAAKANGCTGHYSLGQPSGEVRFLPLARVGLAS